MGKKIVLIIFVFLLSLGCTSTQKNKSEKINPENEEKYNIIRGINYSTINDHEKALENFFKAYEYNSKNIITLRSIGLTYSKIGDTEKGEKYFMEALKISPHDAETLLNLSIIYFKRSKFNKALEFLNEIEIENISDEVYIAKAYSYYKINDFENSYVQFNSLFSNNKTQSVNIYLEYISLLKKMNKYSEIYSLVSKLYSENKTEEGFVLLFADHLIDMEVFDDAHKILVEYGETNEFSKNIVLRLAKVLTNLKIYNEAKKYLDLLPEELKYDKEVLEAKIEIFSAEGNVNEVFKLEKILYKMKRNED